LNIYRQYLLADYRQLCLLDQFFFGAQTSDGFMGSDPFIEVDETVAIHFACDMIEAKISETITFSSIG